MTQPILILPTVFDPLVDQYTTTNYRVAEQTFLSFHHINLCWRGAKPEQQPGR